LLGAGCWGLGAGCWGLGAGCWLPESMKAARSAKIKAEAGFSQTLSYKQKGEICEQSQKNDYRL
jgi:hypothetical protein